MSSTRCLRLVGSKVHAVPVVRVRNDATSVIVADHTNAPTGRTAANLVECCADCLACLCFAAGAATVLQIVHRRQSLLPI